VGAPARGTCRDFVAAIDTRDAECGRPSKLEANEAVCRQVDAVADPAKVYGECIPQVLRTSCIYTAVAIAACGQFKEW
jgi:hypothetical protein